MKKITNPYTQMSLSNNSSILLILINELRKRLATFLIVKYAERKLIRKYFDMFSNELILAY
jgi:hypothetical protein